MMLATWQSAGLWGVWHAEDGWLARTTPAAWPLPQTCDQSNASTQEDRHSGGSDFSA